MSHAIYTASVESFSASLASLGKILVLAAARDDATALLGARLAPDMFPFSTQVQLVCYHASAGPARLQGQEVGRPSILEADFPALQALLAATLQNLATLTAADFAGAEHRRIVMPRQPPQVLDIDGANFLHRWLLPNFYFHYTTAYDILRHNGLAIGKRDFLADLSGFLRLAA